MRNKAENLGVMGRNLDSLENKVDGGRERVT